jgi:hypothetical protein
LRSLAQLYLRQEATAEALDFLEQCLPLFRSVQDRTGEALTMHTLGQLYLDQGRDRESQEFLEASAPFLEQLGSHEGLV